MFLKVELDIEDAWWVRHWSGTEAAGVDIKSNMPPMVQRRGKSQANLADDLRPHVEGSVCILPLL